MSILIVESSDRDTRYLCMVNQSGVHIRTFWKNMTGNMYSMASRDSLTIYSRSLMYHDDGFYYTEPDVNGNCTLVVWVVAPESELHREQTHDPKKDGIQQTCNYHFGDMLEQIAETAFTTPCDKKDTVKIWPPFVPVDIDISQMYPHQINIKQMKFRNQPEKFTFDIETSFNFDFYEKIVNPK